MKFNMRITSVCFLVVMGFSLLSYTVNASEFNFSVVPTKPANQIDKKKGYFDLKVKRGQKQQLTVMLTNATNKAVSIHPKITSATTNSNGVVEYGPTKTKRDSTLKYDMADLVKTKKKVVIPADQTYTLVLDVTMPDDEIDGSIAGGLTLEEDVADKKQTNATSGMAIDNRYAYVLGINLRQSMGKVAPQLELNNVKPSQRNYRNVITANLKNITPTFVNQLKVNAKIMKEGQSEVLYQSNKEMMQMAPNTNFDYPIALSKGEKLEAGTYTLDLTATSFESKWHWQKKFTISNEKAKQLNEKDVTIAPINYWYYIASSLLLIVILLLLLVWWRKKRKKRGNEND